MCRKKVINISTGYARARVFITSCFILVLDPHGAPEKPTFPRPKNEKLTPEFQILKTNLIVSNSFLRYAVVNLYIFI